MPLIKSGSKQAISTNIREMVQAGHPQDQAVAAALSTARKYGKKGGGGVRVNGKKVAPSIGGVMSKPPWKGYKNGGVSPYAKADGGGMDELSPADQSAMMPETFANPLVKQKLGALFSLPQRAIDASFQDVGHLGEEGYEPQSIGPAMETAMQGLRNAGVRPTPGVSGVFVGPYGAKMLREEARAADKPTVAHPVVQEELKSELKGTSPKFRKEAEGAQQDILDEAAQRILEHRALYGVHVNRDVFEKSGWSVGAEGKPRKEIPDIGATLEKIPGTNKYEIKHPAGDFHKIYNIPPIEHSPERLKNMGAKASYERSNNTIHISDPKDPEVMGDVLHELQHAIQYKEGFPGGFNTRVAASRPEFQQEYFPSESKLPNWQMARIASEPSLKGKTINPEKLAKFLTYERAAGETEARNVAERFMKKLYKQHPEDTEDVTRGLQWRKDGGKTKMAMGGIPNPPWFVRSEARGSSGMLKSAIPGRTDKIPLNVPGGSYVLPADIPSALGQGNTMAGGTILDKMFNRGPYGMNLPRSHGSSGMPRMGRLSSLVKVRKSGYASGGDTGSAKIIAAGGEYIIHPHMVAQIGGGDMDRGHKVLDAFVKHVREKHIKTLKNLPGPKKN
jgi:hypothetical protein